jgi:outer membrane protein OmpA-like peptidoglycan-associated protein
MLYLTTSKKYQISLVDLILSGARNTNGSFLGISLKRTFCYPVLLIGFLMVQLNLSGQHKTEKTYYSSEKLRSEGSTYTYPIYYDNKVTGKKHQYFGELVKREKEWKYWFQNGQIERIENYKLIKNSDPTDLPHGFWTYYNYQGIKYREDIYKDGKLESGIKEIYSDSVFAGKISYKNGIPDTTLIHTLTKQNNLIINPDFDYYFYKSVPIIYHGTDRIEAWVPFWTTPGNYTPDYISNLRFIDVLDYNLLFDYNLPGKFNYIGIALFKDDDDYSEYIQGTLVEPLSKGKIYCFKISINTTRFTKYLVNHIACNFSAKPIKVNDQTENSFSPQITFSYLPAEPGKFVTLCDYFTANGGEKFLTIGRFIKKGDLSVTLKDSFPKSQFNLDKSSYYIIDKVELVEVHDLLECNCRTLIDNLKINQTRQDTSRLKLMTNFSELKKGKAIVLNNINFDFDSYILLKSSEDALNSFYQFLIENPGLRFRIDGHTDNIGTDEYNLDLSVRRAKSVYNWLVNKGIQPSRLEYKGFGKRQPLINSTDDNSRAVNRRVEVQIICK